MAIRPVLGTASDEKSTGWFISFHSDWDSFTFAPLAWRDFTLISISGEVASYTQRTEASVCLLGLWVTVTYVWSDEFNQRMKREMAEAREQLKAIAEDAAP